MAVSLSQLSRTLATEAERDLGLDRAAALASAEHAARMFKEINLHGCGTLERDQLVQRLAESCAAAARTGRHGDSRTSDLLGGLADMAGLQRERLNATSRWALSRDVAAVLRGVTNRALADPLVLYPARARLDEVRLAARDVVRAAATDLPDPARVRALHIPLPSGDLHGLAPSELAGEAATRLLTLTGNRTGVRVHEARMVSIAVTELARLVNPAAAKEWVAVTRELAPFVARGGGPNREIVEWARRLHDATTGTNVDAASYELAADLLPDIGTNLRLIADFWTRSPEAGIDVRKIDRAELAVWPEELRIARSRQLLSQGRGPGKTIVRVRVGDTNRLDAALSEAVEASMMAQRDRTYGLTASRLFEQSAKTAEVYAVTAYLRWAPIVGAIDPAATHRADWPRVAHRIDLAHRTHTGSASEAGGRTAPPPIEEFLRKGSGPPRSPSNIHRCL